MGVISFKKKADEFTTPYTCMAAIKKGGIETKLSMVVMGLGNFVHGQKIKGLLFLAFRASSTCALSASVPILFKTDRAASAISRIWSGSSGR